MASKAKKAKVAKADPWRMWAKEDGVDLFRCRKCYHVTDEQNYDVLGADDGNLFCNQCGHEGRPQHVGWMRESFLHAEPLPAGPPYKPNKEVVIKPLPATIPKKPRRARKGVGRGK
jgi:Zn ribbon nucleic-acid-binding protein